MKTNLKRISELQFFQRLVKTRATKPPTRIEWPELEVEHTWRDEMLRRERSEMVAALVVAGALLAVCGLIGLLVFALRHL
jgi:hypothetical protein